MIDFASALEQVEQATPLLPAETVPLADLANRALAAPIVAGFAQPRFDNAAVDGYAVRAEDTTGASRERPSPLQVVGVASAGHPLARPIEPGQCAQIMTGAVVPEGADAVVMVEDTSGFADDAVDIYTHAAPGQHVRRIGEEVSEGAALLPRGTRIGPAEIGTLVTFGYAEALVTRRPRVAIFGTGNELREPGEALGPGAIYNSNAHLLADLARRYGAVVERSPILRDDRDELRRWLGAAITRCDVLISSGGVSAGRFDFVTETIDELGLERRIWKVAQKPGKPLLFATGEHEGQPRLYFGLPGNPVSTLVCALVYACPALQRMQGIVPAAPLTATLAAPLSREAARHRFLFGRLSCEQGQLVARPTRRTGSHMLTSAAGANCLLDAAPGKQPLAAGQSVGARLLPWTQLTQEG